jgi:hypothetical protein
MLGKEKRWREVGGRIGSSGEPEPIICRSRRAAGEEDFLGSRQCQWLPCYNSRVLYDKGTKRVNSHPPSTNASPNPWVSRLVARRAIAAPIEMSAEGSELKCPLGVRASLGPLGALIISMSVDGGGTNNTPGPLRENLFVPVEPQCLSFPIHWQHRAAATAPRPPFTLEVILYGWARRRLAGNAVILIYCNYNPLVKQVR